MSGEVNKYYFTQGISHQAEDLQIGDIAFLYKTYIEQFHFPEQDVTWWGPNQNTIIVQLLET